VAPGPVFSARGRYSHCLRLNCGHASSPATERAVAELGRLAAELCR
jgi:DNA-binding transcriptional MocR family regulator